MGLCLYTYTEIQIHIQQTQLWCKTRTLTKIKIKSLQTVYMSFWIPSVFKYYCNLQVHILSKHAVRALHRRYFKLSKYKSMYFHFLNSSLNLKTKYFQINAFWSQRVMVFSWFLFYRIAKYNHLQRWLYIFRCLLFLLFSIFSPRSKMSRIALIFYLLQQNWEPHSIYKAEGGNWGAKHHIRLTAEQERICPSVLRLAAVMAFPLLQAEGQARKGKLIPCDWSSSPALLQGPGPPWLPWDCSQRPATAQAQGAFLGNPFHQRPEWGHLYLWLDSDRNHQHFACCGM